MSRLVRYRYVNDELLGFVISVDGGRIHVESENPIDPVIGGMLVAQIWDTQRVPALPDGVRVKFRRDRP